MFNVFQTCHQNKQKNRWSKDKKSSHTFKFDYKNYMQNESIWNKNEIYWWKQIIWSCLVWLISKAQVKSSLKRISFHFEMVVCRNNYFPRKNVVKSSHTYLQERKTRSSFHNITFLGQKSFACFEFFFINHYWLLNSILILIIFSVMV